MLSHSIPFSLSIPLSFSVCLVSSLSDGASDRMGLNLSIAPSPHSSYLTLLPSLFSCILLCLCFSHHHTFIFVLDTLFAPSHPLPYLPYLHLASRSPSASPPMMFCCCSLKGLCGGPGLTSSICSHIMESVCFLERLCVSFFALFRIFFCDRYVVIYRCNNVTVYSYHNIIKL